MTIHTAVHLVEGVNFEKNHVVFAVFRAKDVIYRATFFIYRAKDLIYRATFPVYRAKKLIYRVTFSIYRAKDLIYRARFRFFRAIFGENLAASSVLCMQHFSIDRTFCMQYSCCR